MSSVAVAVSATRIARTMHCSTSAVVLAAFSAVLGHYTGHGQFSTQLITHNRWRTEVWRTVATMNSSSLFSIMIDDCLSFGEFVRLTWRRALEGYQRASYDPTVLEGAIRAAGRDRGVHVFRDIFFNDTRPVDSWPDLPELASPEALGDLLVATRIDRSGVWEELEPKISFNLFEATGQALIDFEFDTAFIPVDTARQMLLGIEALLVSAAARRVLLSEVGGVAGVAPAPRDEAWRWMARVGGWVRLAEVERMVSAAADGARCAVFVVPDDDDEAGERVVAYLGPEGADLQPEELHAKVCAQLRSLYGLIAPDRYVFCRTAPVEGSGVGWQSQPVSQAGSGRGSVPTG
jgi:hypothetical protein